MDDIADRLITHTCMVYDSAVSASLRVMSRATLNDVLPAHTGLHSKSVRSNRYALGIQTQATMIALAADLSCDAGGSTPGSLLGFAAGRDADGIASITTDETLLSEAQAAKRPRRAGKAAPTGAKAADPAKVAARVAARRNRIVGLQTSSVAREAFFDMVAAVPDALPRDVDPAQKQVWFEAGGEQVLVTPVISVKVAGELAARFSDREAGFVSRIDMPVGGANPQNVGFQAAVGSRNTRRGHVPLLRVKCREGVGGELARLRTHVLARGVEALATVDRELLASYRGRVASGYDLAVHRSANTQLARDIARQVAETVHALRTATWPPGAVANAPRPPDPDVLALVGAAPGPFDLGTVLDDLTRVLSRRADATQGRADGAAPSPMPRDGFAVLREALEQEIVGCLGSF